MRKKGTDRHRLVQREGREVWRQLCALWEDRTVEKHCSDHHFTAEGRSDFQSHEIVWRVYPPDGAILRGQPSRPDQGQQDVTIGDSVLDGTIEPHSRFDRLRVSEHAVPSERLFEPLEDTARVLGTIVVPIADEDLRLGNRVGHRSFNRGRW